MGQYESAETEKLSPSTIIRRREIEPLLFKAYEVLKSYEKATGVAAAVLDRSGYSIGEAHDAKVLNLCALCKRHYFCTGIHSTGIAEARRTGGLYIYMCELGFVFWTSLILSNGRLSGALIAGGVLGITRQKAAERLCVKHGGNISMDDAEKLLADIPEKTCGEIKSLARTLLLCAEQVSRGTKEYAATEMHIAEQESCRSNQPHRIKDKYPRTAASRADHPPVPSIEQRCCVPLDRERTLLAALRRGDSDAGRKILNTLLENILVSNHHNFDYMRLRALELVVLLSRSAISPNKPEDNSILETNNRYLKRIQDAQNPEELTDILHLIIDRMAGQMFSFHGIRHASALRKAERYVWENYTRKISLKEIAAAAGLSAPYFSSVFKEEMGENLSNYLNRLRVERAAAMLTESDLSLSEIARACGFEDQSWFSKIFKSYTGISPGSYRAGNYHVAKETG